MFSLNLLTNSEGTLALQLIRCDSSNTLTDRVIGASLKGTTSSNGCFVGFKGGSNLGVLRVGESGGNGGNLTRFLGGKREPVLLLRGQLSLRGESDGSVKEGR